MSKVLPYSYSSLTSFETCAYKHYMVKIAKLVAPQEFKAATDGIDVHTQAENYINDGTVFEGNYAPKVIQIVDAMKELEAPIGSEVKLCVTREQEPCDWRDPNAHARGVLDVLQIAGAEAYLKDWKTGRADPFSQQLRHNSMLIFMHNPEVQKVHTEYVWLKVGYSTKLTIHREFMHQDWERFEKRVIMMEKAVTDNKWPKNKSGLCKNYCPVTTCEHNGLFSKNI
jgi:hypothetical protein